LTTLIAISPIHHKSANTSRRMEEVLLLEKAELIVHLRLVFPFDGPSNRSRKYCNTASSAVSPRARSSDHLSERPGRAHHADESYSQWANHATIVRAGSERIAIRSRNMKKIALTPEEEDPSDKTG
jgi:hypothetical protein